MFCFIAVTEEVLWFENFDLNSIVTPVNAGALNQLLTIAGYPAEKKQFLVDGFLNGFSLEYQGDKT